ncbi:MAG: carboxy terminal-processing peptidase [Bacteroidota bacterium]|nr:carboxy terminal-processing peptidase [Bacteroidota bacterium]
MKRIIVIAVVVLTAYFFIAKPFSSFDRPVLISFNDTLKVFKPTKFHESEEKLISTILSRYHYNKATFNDSLSNVVFERYLKTLDYNRNYFLQSDIKEFEKYRYAFGDYLVDGDLTAAYNIFNIFYRRFNERVEYGKKLLDKEMDFSTKEELDVERVDAPWPKDLQEANDLWRKKVKNDALGLLLTGKDWKGIVETLTKRYDNLKKTFYKFNDEDVFQIIMNSYTETVDPHSNYLSPQTSEQFKIDMSLSLEGIGAQLQQDDEYIKVLEIVPGGPAFKSNLLHKNDRIAAVAQGDKGEFVDVVGWRINDVVQLIRGAKGTVVRLQILLASEGTNASPKEIKLVRDKIKLEEQSAKQKIIEIKQDGKVAKIGVITIPTFYSDFDGASHGEKDYKSTTADVEKLLDTLKRANVDGVVIDLRNDGGGALTEAIKLTGLFIKDGPVVQVKNSSGSVDVGDDENSNISYSGPLAVLINKFSASASEIFAGAIQDYGRGLILGDQSYGKGTVQNLIDLNKMLPSAKEKPGQLKLTIAKFYRVTGASTQHKGVSPDIKFPSYFDNSKDFGESSEPSALPWDQIKSAEFYKAGNFKPYLSELLNRHNARTKNNLEWQMLVDDVNDYKALREKKLISLNYETRKKEKEDAENKKFERENANRKAKGLKLLTKEEIKTAENTTKLDDTMLNECGHILADYIALSKK